MFAHICFFPSSCYVLVNKQIPHLLPSCSPASASRQHVTPNQTTFSTFFLLFFSNPSALSATLPSQTMPLWTIRYRTASTLGRARTPNPWILWKRDYFFSRRNSQPFKAKTNRCAHRETNF